MTDFATAIGLALVLEGILYALFPDGMKKIMAYAMTQTQGNLRGGGVAAATLGLGIVWLIRG